jgi:hypothetical protein
MYHAMSKAIRTGRWLQVQGRVKRAWGVLVDDEQIGVAKREAAREIARGADALAAFAKRAARSLAG